MFGSFITICTWGTTSKNGTQLSLSRFWLWQQKLETLDSSLLARQHFHNESNECFSMKNFCNWCSQIDFLWERNQSNSSVTCSSDCKMIFLLWQTKITASTQDKNFVLWNKLWDEIICQSFFSADFCVKTTKRETELNQQNFPSKFASFIWWFRNLGKLHLAMWNSCFWPKFMESWSKKNVWFRNWDWVGVHASCVSGPRWDGAKFHFMPLTVMWVVAKRIWFSWQMGVPTEIQLVCAPTHQMENSVDARFRIPFKTIAHRISSWQAQFPQVPAKTKFSSSDAWVRGIDSGWHFRCANDLLFQYVIFLLLPYSWNPQ